MTDKATIEQQKKAYAMLVSLVKDDSDEDVSFSESDEYANMCLYGTMRLIEERNLIRDEDGKELDGVAIDTSFYESENPKDWIRLYNFIRRVLQVEDIERGPGFGEDCNGAMELVENKYRALLKEQEMSSSIS